MPKDLSATICIEDNFSLVTLVRDGQIALQRTIGYGIDDAVAELTEGDFARNGTGYLDALELLRANHYIGDALRPQVDDGIEIKKSVTASLTMLVGNISRVLDYYFSRNTDVDLSRISLTGLGADCLGLDRLLTNELDVYVETVRKFGSAEIGKEVAGTAFHLAEYYGCIGTSIAPLDFSAVAVEPEKKREDLSIKIPALICVGGLAVSVALVLSAYLSNMFVEMDNTDMRNEMMAKQEIIDTYNSYVSAKMINQEVSLLATDSDGKNDVILAFIDQMEEKMPKDAMVTDFSVTDGEATMSVICSTKASAAEALMQLRQFPMLTVGSCSGVTDAVSETGSKEVSFSVTFQFHEIVEETPEETTEGLESTDGTMTTDGAASTETTIEEGVTP
jgi:type IV pilus assembly protein PilM